MNFTFLPKGVCSIKINIELEGDIIENVEIIGGCAGNTIGISRLVHGMKIDEAIEKLQGIPCGLRTTSCPDQLATALKEAKKYLNKE